MKRLLLVLISGMASAAANAAQFAYVDDAIKISVRSDQGDKYHIVSTVETGTRVEVLERSGDYVRIRDPKGKEGWLRTNYITDATPARERIVHIEKKMAAMEAEKQKLREQLAALESAEKDKQRIQQELDNLRQAAAAPLQLSEDNKVMRQRIQTLEAENGRLQDENENMEGGSQRRWFLTGAGVLFGGILVGLIAPRFRRKKSGWGSDF